MAGEAKKEGHFFSSIGFGLCILSPKIYLIIFICGGIFDFLVVCITQRYLRKWKDFNPQILVVEKAFFANNRNASLLNVLVDEIKAIARRKQLRLVAYSPSTVKKFICGNGWASKEEVSRAVVAKYPKLKVYLTQDRAWKERFHQNMFDAVALGIMATQKTPH